MDDESGWIVIYPSRLKGCTIFLVALVFVGIGIAFAYFRQEMGISLWIVLITSFVGVPFFGACTLYTLYRVVVLRPSLVVDEQGILDNASALAVGFLGWDEIERITPYNYMGQAMLGIFPKDLTAVLARQGRLKRYLLGMNLSLGCAPINIPQVMLPITIDELAIRIERRFGVTSQHDAEDNQPTAKMDGGFRVTITAQEVACEHPKRKRESVHWEEIIRIWYITTSEGPWCPDEWFLFEGESGGCSVPTEAQGFDKIWDELKTRFSGFDYKPILQQGTDDAKYLCWEKAAHPDATAEQPRE